MNQPNPGWYQQPYQQQQPYGQAAPYGQQPGYPQQHPQPGYPVPPGYGPPQRQSKAMAYIATVFFLPAVIYSYIAAFVSWDGVTSADADVIDIAVSTIGFVLADDITGNIDFAISVTLSVASTVAALLVLLACRLGFARWILAVIAGLMVGYYVYAIIYLLSNEAGDFVTLPIVALLLWAVPLVAVVLPPVGRAMRGYRPSPSVAQGHWR
ncbi:hypothetical protein SacmaDRAFT_5578 [Saccharomonospora marina XMU15]|uniref:Uncharacterized protein n=1 Tax=Saccharomonospora marina XMU15 TaxID=882083 RepID=H5XA34_9PSEU|nr:hypothetical protein [Saccharomonospora marina]EHR53694.1 hypothetical protein SacmaDRAFT_5578 [Saccharomonospora marina XMU15]